MTDETTRVLQTIVDVIKEAFLPIQKEKTKKNKSISCYIATLMESMKRKPSLFFFWLRSILKFDKRVENTRAESITTQRNQLTSLKSFPK